MNFMDPGLAPVRVVGKYGVPASINQHKIRTDMKPKHRVVFHFVTITDLPTPVLAL
jgi:hypothetical protein